MPSLAPEPAPAQPDAPRCGKYQLIGSLGQGGMADVFLAVVQGPAGFSKLQVIKRLRQNLTEDPQFLHMFLDEARLAARLNHGNVVQTNEIGEADGKYYIAMEYLDGQPLNRILRRIRKAGAPPRGILLRIIADALAGLHHAHELADYDGTPLKVVHRDASPHNIFVTYEGQTKLVDFGIAKAATSTEETRTGVLKGKVAYMAPEQATAPREVTRQADIFVLGAVLWEVVASQKMWGACAEMAIIARLLKGDIPKLEDACPDAPAALIEICARAIAEDPANRYATAAEMRAAILTYMDQSGERAGSEDVGHFVSELFAEHRREFRVMLERQLSRLSTWSSLTTAEDGSFGSPSARLPRINPSADLSDYTPSNQKLASVSRPTGTAVSSAAMPPSAPTGPSTQPSALVASSVQPATGSTQRYQFLGIALVVALGTVITLRLMGKGPAASESAAPAESARVTSTSVNAAPAPPPLDPPRATGMMELRIQTVPRGAAIFLDGARVPSNPFSAKFPSDGSGHRIRVEASGYTPRSTIVIFDKDVTLDLDLGQASVATPSKGRPEVAASPSPPPQDKPAVAPPPPPPPEPLATRSSKRALDSSNPWATASTSAGAPAKPKRPLEDPWSR